MSKIVLAEQSSAPDTPGSGKVAIYVDTDGSLCWRRDDGTIAKIASAGTYSLTIPATGTAALRNVAQTFTAAQTFSNVLTAPGIKPASDSTTAFKIQNAAGSNDILTVDTTNSVVAAKAARVANVGTLDITSPSAGLAIAAITQYQLPAAGTIVFPRGTSGLLFISSSSSGRASLYLLSVVGITVISEDTSGFSTTAGTANRINTTLIDASANVQIDNGYGTARGVGILYLRG